MATLHLDKPMSYLVATRSAQGAGERAVLRAGGSQKEVTETFPQRQGNSRKTSASSLPRAMSFLVTAQPAGHLAYRTEPPTGLAGKAEGLTPQPPEGGPAPVPSHSREAEASEARNAE